MGLRWRDAHLTPLSRVRRRYIMPTSATIDIVLGFWRSAGPDRWFAKDDGFDSAIRSRFLDAHEAAARGDHATGKTRRRASMR